jgi:glutamate synthase (NADPH/NADH) large chain
MDMVDVEHPTEEEFDLIKGDVERHVAYTNSDRGRRLLDDWDTERVKFRKVIPRQYKRVLEALATAQRLGVDPDAAVMATAQ